MNRSLIYRSPLLYRLMMFCLYGRAYIKRFTQLASLIDDNSSVTELCCGFGDFYRYSLAKKQVNYLGIDLSPDFVKYGLKKGINIIEGDISKINFPESDYYVMMSSLYHFYPNPEAIVSKMLAASRKGVLVMEPIRNLSSSKYKIISKLSRFLTNEGSGKNKFRFNEESLDKMMESNFKKNVISTDKIKNGREKVYVLKRYE